MAVDLQVLFPQSVVPLSSVRPLPGVQPRTLEVIGEDFRSVDEVQVNNQVSPSVVVLSPQRLIVQVPDGVLDRVTSVTVTSNHLTLSDKHLLRFRLGRSPSKVSGIVRLMQLFVKVLLTTQGTDIWAPQLGGNGMRNLGRTFSAQAGQGIVSDFVIAVNQTTRQIIAAQAKDPRIPPDERLLRAQVLSVTYNRNEGALVPTVELLNQTGQPARTSLML